MNDDELCRRLRALPRPTAPVAWRREILAAAEVATEPRSLSWWAWLCQPRRAAWGAIAAAWLVIFALQGADRPPRGSGLPPVDPEVLRAQLLVRQRRAVEPEVAAPPARPTSGNPGRPTHRQRHA